jgi:two-component system, OmpR family, phosphate regulon sensor histidine kinase PhoR
MRLSRIEMHSHVLPRDAVDLRGVLEDVRQSLSPLAEREGVALSVHGVDATILVQGDRDELVQVFQNLIHNAIRYGRKGGIVSVRMERETGTQTVRTSITDDGPGIAAYHLPRLTERFYRADPAASRAKDGTGLGLAIAKHIVQRHRGELEIRSELGKGSTFVVALPMPN